MKKFLRIVGALLVVLVSVLAVPVRARAVEPTPEEVAATVAERLDAVVLVDELSDSLGGIAQPLAEVPVTNQDLLTAIYVAQQFAQGAQIEASGAKSEASAAKTNAANANTNAAAGVTAATAARNNAQTAINRGDTAIAEARLAGQLAQGAADKAVIAAVAAGEAKGSAADAAWNAGQARSEANTASTRALDASNNALDAKDQAATAASRASTLLTNTGGIRVVVDDILSRVMSGGSESGTVSAVDAAKTAIVNKLQELLNGQSGPSWVAPLMDELEAIHEATVSMAEDCPPATAGGEWWALGSGDVNALAWCDPTQEDVRRAVDSIVESDEETRTLLEQVRELVRVISEKPAGSGGGGDMDELAQGVQDAADQVGQGLIDLARAVDESVQRMGDALGEKLDQLGEAIAGGPAPADGLADRGQLSGKMGQWTSAATCLAPKIPERESMCGAGPTIMLGSIAWQPLSYCGDLSMFAPWKRILGGLIVVSAIWFGAQWIIASLGVSTPADGG